METIKKAANYIHDPIWVRRFQSMCGITEIQDSRCAENFGNGYRNRAALGNGFEDNGRPESCKHCETGKFRMGSGRSSLTNRSMESFKTRYNLRNSNAFVASSNGDCACICEGARSEATDVTAASPPNGHAGVSAVGEPQFRIENKVWYYLFSLGASLGNEIFYISFFPFWLWNVDGAVGRRVILLWAFVMFIGQATKDVLCWPRPSSPPAFRIERRYELEYGMPSTHAMVAFSVPFSIIYFCLPRYEFPIGIAVIIGSVWCVVVCLSRLYMGMHSCLDISVGLAFVLVLMAIAMPFMETVDYFLLMNRYAPFFGVGVPFILCLCYPELRIWNTARGDTFLILGSSAGISFGSWVNYQYGLMDIPSTKPPYEVIWPSFGDLGLVLMRLCVGGPIVIATRAILKALTVRSMCYLLNKDPIDKKSIQNLAVELPYKFITYTGIAINVVFLCPYLFNTMRIERPTWFTEI